MKDIEGRAFKATYCLRGTMDKGCWSLVFSFSCMGHWWEMDSMINLWIWNTCTLSMISMFSILTWGKVSYEYLVREYYSCNSRIRQHFSVRRKPVVKLSGFTFSIQAWAYEIFLNLGERCAETRWGFEWITLRISQWRVVDHYSYVEIL